jgi:hypothetical protein
MRHVKGLLTLFGRFALCAVFLLSVAGNMRVVALALAAGINPSILIVK